MTPRPYPARGRRPWAARLAHPMPAPARGTLVAGAVAVLRAARSRLGPVHDGDTPVGLISLDDLLTTLPAPSCRPFRGRPR